MFVFRFISRSLQITILRMCKNISRCVYKNKTGEKFQLSLNPKYVLSQYGISEYINETHDLRG